MTTSINREQISNFLIEKLDVPESEFDENTLLFSEGILDSLNLLELIEFVEGSIGFEIRPRDITLAHFDSINRILAFLKVPQKQC